MAKSIFREKSIQQLSSPEELDSYIKITTPSVWLILISLILLLVGGMIWGIFGRITVETSAGPQTVAPISYILQ